MRTKCPHCLSNATSTKTHQISKMYREITFRCNNDSCGHVFITAVEPIRTISPATNPAEDVNLPLSGKLPDNDNLTLDLSLPHERT